MDKIVGGLKYGPYLYGKSKLKYMLQNHLTHVKGELLFMFVEQYRDMNSLPDGYDYENFYGDVQSVIREINGIINLSDLEKFCEEYGMNDLDNEMSFPNLVKRFYK